jgi:hypothetical protein
MSILLVRARSAFSVTSTEEPDTASAAISIARDGDGTAIALKITASQRFCCIKPRARER